MDRNRRKKKMSAGRIVRIVVLPVLAAALLCGGVFYLRSRIAERYAKNDDASYETATVTTGSIRSTVYGSGALSDEESVTAEVPEDVTLKTVYVETGDSVSAGQTLASVNGASVLAAMTSVQDEIDTLDKSIADAASDTVSEKVTAGVSGRVKLLFAEKGDDVAAVMREHGALAVLSLDGTLSCTVETTALAAGDTVTVTVSDGTQYSGTVDAVKDGTATVLVTDNGPLALDAATVADADGNVLGAGALEIHSPLKITGYAGTVDAVRVKENATTRSSTVLFTLTDTAYTANYETLLKERADLETELNELIAIYRSGVIVAPVDGVVKAIPDEETETDDFEICPNTVMTVSLSVDETDILSLSVGQSATVEIEALGLADIEGRITEIDRTGTVSSGTTLYQAVVEIEKQDGMLNGMTATATVTIESVENALLVPTDAIRKTRATTFVYTAYDEETDSLSGMVEVTVGLSNSSYTVITDGLKEGDVVYYESESSSNGFNFGNFGGTGMPGGFSGGSGMPGGFSGSGSDRPDGFGELPGRGD